MKRSELADRIKIIEGGAFTIPYTAENDDATETKMVNTANLQHLENYKETLQQMTKEELIEEGNSSMTEDFIKLYSEEIERRQSLIPNNVA